MAPTDDQERVGIQLELPRSVVESVILAARRRDHDQQEERERLARIIVRSRQQRAASFPAIVFGEPGWDMILQLYIADCAGRPVDVSSLCAATGVAKTTALRHLDRLEQLDILERRADRVDGRRIFVLLREDLRRQTERWLDSMRLALDIGTP